MTEFLIYLLPLPNLLLFGFASVPIVYFMCCLCVERDGGIKTCFNRTMINRNDILSWSDR